MLARPGAIVPGRAAQPRKGGAPVTSELAALIAAILRKPKRETAVRRPRETR